MPGAKKPRWSATQKASARKSAVISASAKRREAPSARDERRDDRGPRSFERRDDRAPRSFDRRDDRGSDRRDDRAPRSFDRRDDRRDDRAPRSFDRRDDRAPRSFDRRDDRRDDRAPRSFDRRDDRGSDRRDDRAPRSFDRRDDRRSDRRDDRAPRSFERRDDRRDDRAPRSFERRDDRHGERTGGYDQRPRWEQVHEQAQRDGRGGARPDQSSRPDERRFERRDDRGTDRRDDRRPDRGEDRGFERRPDRPRFERSGGRPERRISRDEHRFERRQHHGSPRDQRFGDRGMDHDQFDPEAERLEADSWTKATRRPVSTEPVQVAQDNGFAALGLPERLVERLARDGITEPFPIQAETIPDALAGRDVLGRGQTGSGKTLAFGLPMIARLAEANEPLQARRPQALVLVPTRELAMQVSDALEPLVHVMSLRHKVVAGGLSYTTQIAALSRGIHVLVATPGRLVDLIERGAVELDQIKIVVIDEADHMADMGFMPEVSAILDKVADGGQRLLFSATLDRGVDGLVERYLTDPVTHEVDSAQAAVDTMEHHALLINPQDKKQITAEVAGHDGRTVVFVRTKLGADRVARELRERGVVAAALHGGLNQSQRNRVLGAFRDGRLPVLVATDVAARGIHVDDVSVVLQVDPPADHKDYLHRSGRTARAGERGAVFMLALPHQKRTVERLLADAGVDTEPTRVSAGDATLLGLGARIPSGIPISDEQFARLIEGDRPQRRGGYQGQRGGYQGQRGGGRGGYGGDRREGGYRRGPRG